MPVPLAVQPITRSPAGRKTRARVVRALAFVLAVIAVACAPGTRVARRTPTRLPSVDEVLGRYFRAVGGEERLLSVRSRQMWGTYSEGAMTARTDIAWQRPSTRRVNIHAPGFEYSEGFDGRTWEFNFRTNHLVVDTGAAEAAGRRGAEFDESFVDYRMKGHRVAMIGSERFEGRDAYRLRVSLTDGWEKDYLFDQESGLIVAVRKAMPVHASGPAVESMSTYEDWRETGGLLQPHRFSEREVVSGRLMNTLQWDSIRVNGAMRADQLARPVPRPN